MHIPEYLLHGTICPVTAAISIGGLSIATYFSIKSKEKPTISKFGVVTALIFLLQMLNFPISGGTSGHFLGTSFAIFTLGIPFGIISISIILTIQALVFSDGGLTVLGANILNMAMIGAIPTVLAYILVNSGNKLKKNLAIFSSAWLSLVFASASCSVLLSLMYPENTIKIFYSMVVTHSIIGVGEAIFTLLLTPLFNMIEKTKTGLSKIISISSIFVILLLLTPFASKLPDGLDWVVEKYQLFKESEPLFVAPLPDYSVAGIQNEYLSTAISGLLGIILIFLIIYGITLTTRNLIKLIKKFNIIK